jgi:hypothetical protein
VSSLMPWGISLLAHVGLNGGAVAVVRTVSPAAPPAPEAAIVRFFDPAPGGLALIEPEGDADDGRPVVPPTAPAQAAFALEPGASARAGLGDTVAALAPRETAVGPAVEITETAALSRPVALPEVTFAGLGAGDAPSVVYVVDGSGSMVSSMPIVVNDLKSSLARLSPAQTFQVIVFRNTKGSDFTAAPHPADRGRTAPPRMIRATRENVEAVCGWLEAITPGGRSNPVPALKAAVALRPRAVFLLSKVITGLGEWEPDKAALLAELDGLNRADPLTGNRPTTIKTIQFLDRDPQGVLEAIGRAHGGPDGHTFISRDSLRTR